MSQAHTRTARTKADRVPGVRHTAGVRGQRLRRPGSVADTVMATAAFAPVSTGILVPAAAADQYPESFDKTFKQTLIRTVDGFDEQQYRERCADCELDEHTTGSA